MRFLRDRRGVALLWAAVSTPIMLLILILMVDILRWRVHAQELQSAVDAGALAGGQELYLEQWIDDKGNVYFARLYIDEQKAIQKALEVLDENLNRMRPGPSTFIVSERQAEVITPNPDDPSYQVVRVTASIQVNPLLADRIGLVPPEITRSADARPICEGPPCIGLQSP